ncbi:MAG TPA: SAM-dependent methyltransferase [Nitrospiria bacterium]|jgi:SAM-dependent MidA family methyltransferase|nr:SAM-dependent methyltransferase [Nitrospiria bacterium]
MPDEGRAPLIHKIQEEIRQKGRMTFARFMERALYDPEEGYYTSSGERIGLGGDYYTSPEVHPIFGRLLAKQIRQMETLLPGPGPFTILEMGAGKGLLARDILAGLKTDAPEDFRRFRYAVIERSPAMAARQKALLAFSDLASPVRWYSDIEEVQAGGSLVGCVLSNELVDAFPVHRVVATKDGLDEIYVDVDGDRFVETREVPSTPDLEAYFKRLKIRLAEGQRAEVNLEAARWIREVGKALDLGFVITIDYGYPASELFAPHRKKGSLLCYYRHTVNDDPYARIGEQDITAHVDFTGLARAGAEAGLSVTGFTNQLNFLMSLGIAREMERFDPESPEMLSVKRLLARESMGGVFKVLIQHKGLTPPPLEGLTFRPYFNDVLAG